MRLAQIKNFLYLKIYSLSIPPSSRFVRLICIGYSVSDFYATSVLGLTAFTPTDDSTLSGRTSLNVFSARFIVWHRCSCLKQKINIEKDTAKRKKAERFEKKNTFGLLDISAIISQLHVASVERALNAPLG